MSKVITVNENVNIPTEPNYVEVFVSLHSKGDSYSDILNKMTMDIKRLTDALSRYGYNEGDLKTSEYHVDAEYKTVTGSSGIPRRIFDSYVLERRLKLEFILDEVKLTDTLSAITNCMADCDTDPNLSVLYTMKEAADSEKAIEAKFSSAMQKAKQKAEFLCKALGVELGDICNISYNEKEIDACSNTKYNINVALPVPSTQCLNVEPLKIDSNGTVTFVWKIK